MFILLLSVTSYSALLSLTMSSIPRSLRYNWDTLRRDPFSEIAGSLGDLGTLLPIMTALTASGAISLTSTLLFSGLANILSGAFFGIPIVVWNPLPFLEYSV